MVGPLVELEPEPEREVLQRLSCRTLYPFMITVAGARNAMSAESNRVWS